jgi:hypothetical protein
MLLGSVNWEALTAIGTLLLAAIGALTLVFVRTQIKDFRKESRVKRIVELVEQFECDPMATYRRDLAVRRIAGGTVESLDVVNPPPEMHSVMNFFEHMGYLLEGGYLSLEDVTVEFHYWILHLWADTQRLIAVEQTENPIYYEFFKKMVHQLLDYDRPGTGKLMPPNNAELLDFYAEESKLKTGSPLPRQKPPKPRPPSGW